MRVVKSLEACSWPADGVAFQMKNCAIYQMFSENLLEQDQLYWTLTFYNVNAFQNLVGEHVPKTHLPKNKHLYDHIPKIFRISRP